MGATRFTDLKVWQQAHQIVLDVYHASATFPRSETFGLAAQMRSAAVSVPSNIAEGFGRRSPKDRARFYEIAKASLNELDYQLLLARELGYAYPEDLRERLNLVGAMLHRLRDCVVSDLRGG